jgi:hypothetical protein
MSVTDVIGQGTGPGIVQMIDIMVSDDLILDGQGHQGDEGTKSIKLRNNISFSGVYWLFNTGLEFRCVGINQEGRRPEWLIFSHQNNKHC